MAGRRRPDPAAPGRPEPAGFRKHRPRLPAAGGAGERPDPAARPRRLRPRRRGRSTASPRTRVVNLETAVTTSDRAYPKAINYRMHPRNAGCLAAAGIDCCVLANNHARDWGHAGLAEEAHAGRRRHRRGRRSRCGAGRAPASTSPRNGRVLVFAFAPLERHPADLAAGPARPGSICSVTSRPRRSPPSGGEVRAERAGDVAVASVHRGGNFGYEVPVEHRTFARLGGRGRDRRRARPLVAPPGGDRGVRGLARPLRLRRSPERLRTSGLPPRRPQEFRVDHVLLYAVTLEQGSGDLVRLELDPFRGRRWLRRPGLVDATWLRGVLDREGERWDPDRAGRPALVLLDASLGARADRATFRSRGRAGVAASDGRRPDAGARPRPCPADRRDRAPGQGSRRSLGPTARCRPWPSPPPQ